MSKFNIRKVIEIETDIATICVVRAHEKLNIVGIDDCKKETFDVSEGYKKLNVISFDPNNTFVFKNTRGQIVQATEYNIDTFWFGINNNNMNLSVRINGQISQWDYKNCGYTEVYPKDGKTTIYIHC